MSELDNVVTINVTTQSANPTQPGFGIPLIVDAHSRFAERVRVYGSPDDMLADGFVNTDAAYLAAVKVCSQNPKVTTFAVGRRANAPAQKVSLVPVVANNTVYSGKVGGKAFSYTSDGTATLAEILAGLKTAIDALAVAGLTSTNTGTSVDLTSTALWFQASVDKLSALGIAQIHADPGIGADLDAIKLENDTWYGFALTTQGNAEIQAAAAWAEANAKFCVQASQDSAIVTTAAPGTDVAASLKASNLTRTGVVYHGDNSEFAGLALLGCAFPYDPGSVNFKFLTLASVTADKLSPTQIANAKAKNANVYVTVAGIDMITEGTVASGQFLDVIRDTDWFDSILQNSVFAALVNGDGSNPGSRKVPFDDSGVGNVENAVRGAIKRGEKAGFLVKNSAVINVPLAVNVPTSDRNVRKLTGMSFTARIAGAINKAVIKGNISV